MKTAQTAPTRSATGVPWSTDLMAVGASVGCAMITWLFAARLANLELTVRRGSELESVGVWQSR